MRHTNPKRKRGPRELPRLRFGLVYMSIRSHLKVDRMIRNCSLQWACWLKFLFTVLLVAAKTCPAAEALVVLPQTINLTGSKARQSLLIQHQDSYGLGAQVRDGIEWSVADTNIASMEHGTLVPIANGQTTVSATVAGQSVTAVVSVTGMEKSHSWNFRNHVQAILAKAGCNSGACHGALAGKGGLKLSLRGYNTVADYHTLTRQALSRRIELSDPGQSLLLTKPSGAIPHKGGVRFEVGSLDYEVISEWIAAGAPAPHEGDPSLQRLEVLPQIVSLAKGNQQQFLIVAHYSDGHSEDVTRWAKFTSANETVATIDPQGQITVVGSGVDAVTAWFAQRIVNARVTVPYENEVRPEVYAKAERRNFIDELSLKQLERLKLPPSDTCNDGEFVRRVFLDTIGILPSADEVRSFLADPSVDKRDKVIESLLSRPEFVDYWTYMWSDVFLVTGENLRPQAVKSYYQWIRNHVQQNTPWDKIVREMVTSQGSTFENGATNFFALHQDPETMSENVSQAFLGLSIGCAKCHNHPLEKWTNDQYYAMANLFARVRAKGWGGDPRSGDGLRTVYAVDRGELLQPRTGKPQLPTPLDGEPMTFDSQIDRRVHLADWLVSDSNPYFARSIANRVWANFFGVGLVEPVDDMRVSNPASNEELLAAAAKFLTDNRFELKQLMRVILQSKTYQRSSMALPENQTEDRFYSRYYPRRLMAEVLLDAISQVADVPTDFVEIAYPGADRQKTDFYPKGTRALQLYDSAVSSYFLRTFGRNQRLITCECERSDEPSMVQVLHISNGDTINQKLRTAGNRVEKLLSSGAANEAIIDEAYLLSLSRFPTESEKQGLLRMIAEAPESDRRIAIEDVFWGVISSREFLFNH